MAKHELDDDVVGDTGFKNVLLPRGLAQSACVYVSCFLRSALALQHLGGDACPRPYTGLCLPVDAFHEKLIQFSLDVEYSQIYRLA